MAATVAAGRASAAGGDLRAPGGILLLSTYDLGRQPLALAWPAAVLRGAGYQAATIDTACEAVSDEALRRARLIAVSTPMHTALRLAVPLLRRARAINPQAQVVAYGLYAALNEEYLRHERLVDTVLGGEMEDDLLALAHRLDGALGLDLAGPPGASGRTGLVARVRLPTPDRAGLAPPHQYARLHWRGGERLVGSAESTRGCRHTCRHCPVTPIFGGRFFAVPVATVLADVRQQVAAGIEHISFGDPDFLNGPTHALRVARALHADFPNLTFDATVKIEHILQYPHHLRELASLGCIFVVSAVESRSDTVLQRLRKGHTRADVDAALALLDDVGIDMRPSLLAFTPWTSASDYLELIDWILEEGLQEHVDPVHLAIRLLVPPGSALLADPETAGCFGALDAASFSHTWRHPDPRMDSLHDLVTRLVTDAEANRQPPAATIVSVREAAAQLVAGARATPPVAHRPAPPRLTESWFC